MFMMEEGLLNPQELQRVATICRQGKFQDGRSSNPHNTTKISSIGDMTDPLMLEAAQICTTAIQRNERVRNFVLPTRIAPPSPGRYGVGGKYGAHVDAALMTTDGPPMRSDVSCSIFISDPASYQGGELIIYLGDEVVGVKGKPGSAIFYPSTTLHQVNAVSAGERLVMLTFIESAIADPQQRELLYALEEVRAREGLKIDWSSRVRLEFVRENLIRMWKS